jgi:hypothetical protein
MALGYSAHVSAAGSARYHGTLGGMSTRVVKKINKTSRSAFFLLQSGHSAV